MKWVLCAVVAIFGSLAGADPVHYNINDRVDNLLPDLNKFVLSKHLDQIPVADYGVESAPVLIGVRVSNLSSLVRTGDAEMWEHDEKTLAVSVNLGLKDARVHVDSAPFIQGRSSVWELRDASAHLLLTLHPTALSECVTSYQQITITRLGKITIHTSDPAWDGKAPPQHIVDGIVDYYNKWNNLPENLESVDKNMDLCQSN
ncbi:hypothetical protein AAG570_009130 [Ranatra chinensis]|uniref:Uncharacterized protein n=1 Tax=Ranatra chinensis TaxID=642074 RepID=A0ABD0YV08_9HEMI